MSLYDRLFKPRRYTLPNGTVVEEKRSRAPLIILIVLALGALSAHITGFNFAVLVKKGSKFFDILTAMFPPNTGYLLPLFGLSACCKTERLCTVRGSWMVYV